MPLEARYFAVAGLIWTQVAHAPCNAAQRLAGVSSRFYGFSQRRIEHPAPILGVVVDLHKSKSTGSLPIALTISTAFRYFIEVVHFGG